ncbi:hypothetical protein ABEB36_003845 [Hypothenemus hampei]
MCDVDGVIWDMVKLIDGSTEGINALRSLGKKLYFVTNNSTSHIDLFLERLKVIGVKKEEVIRPGNSLIWYLKKMNFQKEVYVIGFETLKDELRKAGFKVVSDELVPIDETVAGVAEMIKNINPNVSAIVVDMSVNLTYNQLQKCVEYIKRNNAQFLTGSWDDLIPFLNFKLIGPALFSKIIQQVTQVNPKILSKPGKEFQEVLEDNIGPYDPKRVLFIGDSIHTDMVFATNCGFQKLLPLTGLTSEEDIKNWKWEKKIEPDYYVDNLKIFSEILHFSEKRNNKL